MTPRDVEAMTSEEYAAFSAYANAEIKRHNRAQKKRR